MLFQSIGAKEVGEDTVSIRGDVLLSEVLFFCSLQLVKTIADASRKGKALRINLESNQKG